MKRRLLLLTVPVFIATLLAFGLDAARSAQAAPALTFIVDTTLDLTDTSPGDGSCHTANNKCSLRAAAQEADNQSNSLIFLPAGTYVLTNTGNGDLTLFHGMTISATGASAPVVQGMAGWHDRIFRIQGGAHVTITGVTVRGGNTTASTGGGIEVLSATLNLNDSTIRNNQASEDGGGIYVNGGGHLVLSNSTVRNNSTNTNGGGIANAGALTLADTSVTTNTADADGGGLDNSGNATLTGDTLTGNTATTSNGGGISNETGGNLTVHTSTLTGNNAANGEGGALYSTGTATVLTTTLSTNQSGSGGGIYVDTGSMLTLRAVTLNANSTGGVGGGIYVVGTLVATQISLTNNMAQIPLNGFAAGMEVDSGAHATLDGAYFSGNQSANYGGGVVNVGTLSLTNSIFLNNNAGMEGGGILNAGSLNIDHSVFSNNTSSANGGGLSNGLYVSSTSNLPGTLVASNVTFNGNVAGGGGGGLANETGTSTVDNATLNGNSAVMHGGGLWIEFGLINVGNTVLAGNSSGAGGNDCNTFVSEGYNLIQDVSGCAVIGVTTGDITGTNPLLGPLQNNGGATPTQALLPGSPAFNAGNPAAPGSSATACALTDQRGTTRPQGGRCDMGAYEVGLTPLFLPMISR